MIDLCKCGHARKDPDGGYRECLECRDVRRGDEVGSFTCRPGVCDRFTWTPAGQRHDSALAAREKGGEMSEMSEISDAWKTIKAAWVVELEESLRGVACVLSGLRFPSEWDAPAIRLATSVLIGSDAARAYVGEGLKRDPVAVRQVAKREVRRVKREGKKCHALGAHALARSYEVDRYAWATVDHIAAALAPGRKDFLRHVRLARKDAANLLVLLRWKEESHG